MCTYNMWCIIYVRMTQRWIQDGAFGANAPILNTNLRVAVKENNILDLTPIPRKYVGIGSGEQQSRRAPL